MSTETSKKKTKSKNDKRIKLNFVTWVMIITLVGLLILILMTAPNRRIRKQIMRFESQEEVVNYCVENDYDCYFTTVSDYDIEGYQVSRVSFLAKDFFGSEETSEGSEVHKVKKNIYITTQVGISVDVPSEG